MVSLVGGWRWHRPCRTMTPGMVRLVVRVTVDKAIGNAA
jgi:hypothetical protein